MSRLALALSLAALAALGACHSPAPITSVQPAPVAYRAGFGTVQAVTPAPLGMAAAGASGQSGTQLYRLTVKMDDGRTQYIDVDTPEWSKGQRVELSEDRLIAKR